MRSSKSTTSAHVVVAPAEESTTAPTAALGIQQPSPWHSPVPYLFGGLAAMLGLIAFALLILVCSYWKISSGLEDNDEEVEMKKNKKIGAVVYEEQFVVILAGDDKPSCLATPAMTASAPINSFNIISAEDTVSTVNKLGRSRTAEP